MNTSLPTPNDTSRAEDHADAGHEGGPSFFDLGCLSNLAVLIGVFLYGCLVGTQVGLKAMLVLLFWFFVAPILPIVVWITGAAAYMLYKNRPFMNEGPQTLALFLILAATAMLVTFYRFSGLFLPVDGVGSISGGMNVVDNLELLIVAALVILYLGSRVYHRFVVWITAVAADNAKYYAPVQRGAGKGKFFLDEDE